MTTLDELKAAAEQQRLRALPGLGARIEEKILKALAEERDAGRRRARCSARGCPAVLAVVDALRDHPTSIKVSEAGSVRRRRETFRDLDVIATSSDPAALTAPFVALPFVVEVVAHGDTKATVVSNDGLRFDLRVVPPESYGNLLQHFTGSKDHNVALREDAVTARALRLGVRRSPSSRPARSCAYANEEEVYARLGYAYIPPELRENGGELEAARRGELPALVELGDLRGDLHSHSTGRPTARRRSRRWRSPRSRAGTSTWRSPTTRTTCARAGSPPTTRRSARLNERLAPFRLLRGVEVNIRADGSLDMSDEELAARDWVVASLHTSFDRSPTERVLAAMENPHVDCIGHLTARKINTRPAADVDVERVVAKALETGTALEINSQPDRLDLRDAHARAAGEAGVPVLVSTDAHRLARARVRSSFALAQARRAWLTKEQVLNTRTVAADPEADEAMSFREDGHAALEWVARYLERVGELPVLAQVEPGEIRAALPASPPERGEPFAERAARPRRGAAAGGHALAAPALLRLLRDHAAPSRASSPSS